MRLLVVEDEAGIRDSLVDYFLAHGALVDAAATVAEAEARLGAASYTVVLLDLALPDGDGVTVLRALRRRGDRTPVVVLTARGEEDQRVLGLRSGADDYLVKPFSVRELEARIEAVLRRTGAAPGPVTAGSAEIDLAGHTVRRAGREHALSAKEAELLGFLMRNAGRTFARADLLREVWGHHAMPTTRTVDTHVFQLRKKIESDPTQPAHLLTVHRVGYRWVD